ncbi:substrate-binding domain-containing protein [Cellulosimicrobium marinum]|uniref:substrate-binding domain-containing protein n=1 Tax=Cellulosimicrobium marinum TaxID=1638992 RepID=UPI001E4FB23B|nr:substrate-binding domain-containing protein [Cellulosimicrobium marinum]MCB7137435.1 substrate-binding domain-containing protein [Cellulosimicrobium marinum]
MTTEEMQRAPLAAERRAHLLASLKRDGVVRVADLTGELGVTAVTVRRDIAQLEREGLLARVHGGAVPAGGTGGGTEPAARATIGVLVPSLDYYWPGVVRGMEAEARKHGLRVVLRGSSYEAADERPALERLVATSDLQGLILAPRTDSPQAQELAQWLARTDVPSVLVEREAALAPHREALESVVSDHALGALMAVHHLADLGHRRVGLVISRQSPTSRKIAAGWRAACADLGLSSEEHFERLAPDRHRPEFAKAISEVVDTAVASGTTALLAHSDPEAFAIVQNAQDRGMSVPGDLSVVAYDDEVAGLFSPALTAVRPPRAAVGHAAVDLLAKRIADPSRPVHRVAISPTLVVRESTGRVARRP